MSTQHPIASLEAALSGIPKKFRDRIITAYLEVKRAFVESRYDVCILKTGRFCEVALRLLQQLLTSTYIPFNSKISNFKTACEKLELAPKTAGQEGLRILIPRILVFLYSIRNKRDAGHVGGEVDVNPIDASLCAKSVDWCLCELIRIYHNLSLEEAQDILDSITTRELPQVWSVLGRKRILDTSLSYKEKTLLLLYSDQNYAVPTEDLYTWIEHPRLSDYKQKILTPMHKEKIIEYDKDLEMIVISPKGIAEVETNLLPK